MEKRHIGITIFIDYEKWFLDKGRGCMLEDKMTKIVLAETLLWLMLSINIHAQGADMDGKNAVAELRIKMTIGDAVLTAKMDKSPTTMDFYSMLPMTIKLEDYAGTEKIGYLPRKLTIKDSPAGSDPSPGDIAYYAPWGNIAIFYRDFGYSTGLIIFGKLESGIELFSKNAGTIEVKVER